MVYSIVAGLLAFSILGFFTVQALATLASWVSVGAAALTGITVFYVLVADNQTGLIAGVGDSFKELFDSEFWSTASAVFISVAATGLSYKLIQAVFASLGWGAALAASALIVAAVISSPAAVASVLGSGITYLLDFAGGES